MKRFESEAFRSAMRVRLDFNFQMSEFIGSHGIDRIDIEKNMPLYEAAAERMEQKRDRMRWRLLPFGQREVVASILAEAKRIRSAFDTFVVLGIGGSALGPSAVQYALNHLKYNDLPAEKRNGPRFFVEDNIDPERFRALLDVVDLKHTAFNVITKSGSTSETMSQLLLIVDALKKEVGDSYASHLIATTDEKKGNLIKIAKELGLTTFYVPDGVGGRFSELCPVGLLPAAVCGIDIEELLAGAAYMDEICSSPNIWENPAYMSAALEVLSMERGCNISVMMPYAESLRYMADWYAQLWAESLGKRVNLVGEIVHTGQTPVKALGVTDQHSQVQLYTEGPYDKVITFLSVDDYRVTEPIPHAFDEIPDVAFLSGHTLNELIKAEQTATEYAVMRSGHPSKTITLPEVNAFTVGQLLYLFEMQTAFAGELLGIDAFDQPGVEEGKNATYALLGKPGYDEKRRELAERPARKAGYTI